MITLGGGRLVQRTLEGEAWHSAAGSWSRREILWLEVEDAQGVRGRGEACPLPGYSPDTLEAAGEALEQWLIDPPRALEIRPGPPLLLSGAACADLPPSARCAVECAIIDLAARRAGEPLHRWLGGPAGASVGCQALIPLLAPEAAERRARELWDAGFRTMKVKGGEDFELEAALLRRLRESLGAELRLRLDVGGRWSLEQARRHLEQLVPLDLDYVEQPVGGHVMLRVGPSPVALAADESLQDPTLAGEILDAGVCAVLVLKPPCLGGPVRTLELIERARRRGLRWVLSHTLGSGLERALAVELALATGADTSGLAEHPLLPAEQRPAAWSGPTLPALEYPGLGLEVEDLR